MKDDIFEKSIKIKMQEFLNSLESSLYSKMSKGTFDIKKMFWYLNKFLKLANFSVNLAPL